MNQPDSIQKSRPGLRREVLPSSQLSSGFLSRTANRRRLGGERAWEKTRTAHAQTALARPREAEVGRLALPLCFAYCVPSRLHPGFPGLDFLKALALCSPESPCFCSLPLPSRFCTSPLWPSSESKNLN
ncbi:hypothetical protein HispidOSU_029391 [Sigmodon hispidus]